MSSDKKSDHEKKIQERFKGIKAGGYFLSFASLAIAIYTLLFSGVMELQTQAIYWFSLSAICLFVPSIIPYVELVKIKDIEFHIEKLQEAAKEQEKNIAEKERLGNQAVMRIYQYLNAEGIDITLEDEKAIKGHIIDAPLSALSTIFASASTYRMNLIYQMLETTDKESINYYKKKQEKLIPIFEALLQSSIDTGNRHDYYAQLAYIYKDKLNPEWDKAYDNIDKAIEDRDKHKLGNIKLTIYEFNRLVSGINAFRDKPARLKQLQEQFENDFDIVYNDNSARYMLFETDEILAPGLSKWAKQNKPNEYNQWNAQKQKL